MFPPTLPNPRLPSAQWAVNRLQGLARGRKMPGPSEKVTVDSVTFGHDLSLPLNPEKKDAEELGEHPEKPVVYGMSPIIPIPLLPVIIAAGWMLGGPLAAAGLLLTAFLLVKALLSLLQGKARAAAIRAGVAAGLLILSTKARTLFSKKTKTPPPSPSPMTLPVPASPTPCISPIQTSKLSLPVSNPFLPSRPIPGEKLTIHLPTPQPSHPALTQGMPLHQLTRPVAFILMDPHEGKASLLIYRPATRQFQIIRRPANFLRTGNPNLVPSRN